MQPNPIAATALKSTQSTVCASEQMAGLVAVKTMGRVSTHGLSQHIHTESHSVGAFHTCGKQEVHYTGGVAVGGTDTGNSILPFHLSHCRQMYLSCRYRSALPMKAGLIFGCAMKLCGKKWTMSKNLIKPLFLFLCHYQPRMNTHTILA